jgi:hypothetical protein
MKRTPPASRIDWPWGKIGALAAWCAGTLIGIGCGLDPDVILLRTLVAALLVGVTAAVIASVVKKLFPSV